VRGRVEGVTTDQLVSLNPSVQSLKFGSKMTRVGVRPGNGEPVEIPASLHTTKSGVRKDVKTDGGMSGNLITLATWDGIQCVRKIRFGIIGKSQELSGEREMKGVTP